jgi:hypothetical protein
MSIVPRGCAIFRQRYKAATQLRSATLLFHANFLQQDCNPASDQDGVLLAAMAMRLSLQFDPLSLGQMVVPVAKVLEDLLQLLHEVYGR